MINCTGMGNHHLDKDEPLVAKFVGYSACFLPEPEVFLNIHFESRGIMCVPPGGFGVTWYEDLTNFMQALPRLVTPLEAYVRNESKPRFPKPYRAKRKPDGSIKVWARKSEIRLCPNTEPRAFIETVQRNMHRVLPYIDACFELSRRLERPPYEKFLNDMESNGYATVHFHGVALLSAGRIEFRPVMRTAKY